MAIPAAAAFHRPLQSLRAGLIPVPVTGVDLNDLPERFVPLFRQNPWFDTFDLEVVSYGEGKAELRFSYEERFTQYQGVIQGGVLAGYADAAIAVAVTTLLPEGKDMTTTDLCMQYVRPARSGPFIVKAEVLDRGNTLLRCKATVEIEGGGVCARCTSTYMIISPRAGRP